MELKGERVPTALVCLEESYDSKISKEIVRGQIDCNDLAKK